MVTLVLALLLSAQAQTQEETAAIEAIAALDAVFAKSKDVSSRVEAVNALAAYQRARLFCFLNPYADPQGACYQLVQALNAVGSGGWFGQGLTAGRQNQLGYLPVHTTDFIFTVVAEELGFVGGLLMLSLFALLLWRILVIGWGARDALGSMVAWGLASMLLFQLLVNVGMVVGFMPVTGIPLPLMSSGGSNTFSIFMMLGLVNNVRLRRFVS